MKAVTRLVVEVAASGLRTYPFTLLIARRLRQLSGSHILPILPIIKLQEVPIHTSELTRKRSAVGLRLLESWEKTSRGFPRPGCSVRFEYSPNSAIREIRRPLPPSLYNILFHPPTDHIGFDLKMPTFLVYSLGARK